MNQQVENEAEKGSGLCACSPAFSFPWLAGEISALPAGVVSRAHPHEQRPFVDIPTFIMLEDSQLGLLNHTYQGKGIGIYWGK